MMIKWTVLALTLVGGLYRVVLNLLRRRSANNPTPQNVADVYDAETYQTWKRYNAEKGLVLNRKWRVYGKGAAEIFETSKDGARLTFGSVTNDGVRAVALVAPKGGLKPNTRYRVSWFARIEDVSVAGTRYGTERGFYVYMQCGGGAKGVRVPSGASFRGSFDWRHMSGEIVTPAKPWGHLEVLPRLLVANGLAEIEDLTIEEIK